MASLARGTMLTLKSMGFGVLFRELLRRAFGIRYHFRNIPISSDMTFRIIRNVLLKGYDVHTSGNDIIVRTPFGELWVSATDADLLSVLCEPLEDMYGFVDVKGAVIVDIGAYIGETALLFLFNGARRVYAFEPVYKHFYYLLKNVTKNNAIDRIIPLNYGAWFREGVLEVNYGGPGTGLRAFTTLSLQLKVKHLSYILREVFEREGRIDLVKMDCEGCEYSLLSLPTGDIKLAKQYIIEVHGAEGPIIDRMTECGYRHRFIENVADLISLHYFEASIQ